MLQSFPDSSNKKFERQADKQCTRIYQLERDVHTMPHDLGVAL